MSSSRREARRLAKPSEVDGIPADLAGGPCVEVWADRASRFPQHSARLRWKAARDAWMRSQDLDPRTDYRQLPRVLRDRAPYFREDTNQ